ncbi:hypothetical protein MNB_SM-7-865 [hydrothermal vent metagenome]|uniref:Uncharacterized protein n=1 Tax=hydrothermal vent metagenome TaxID=652676 RepID=A0A1W1BVP1_9ZZZZ
MYKLPNVPPSVINNADITLKPTLNEFNVSLTLSSLLIIFSHSSFVNND